ncbi:GAD-like domain-containing protein [Pseudomonas alabamensis]|uniref:GAD-like domain-containing protein n=1 Tax=Pseudomonas alabamensis TaxID=3064349 RepID=UPI003F64D81F
MDTAFPRFIEKVGAQMDCQTVPESSIALYTGKLPDQLIDYWQEHGWGGYGKGLFWTVNPQEYEGVLTHWIEGTCLDTRDTYHLIARSAFGDLYLWGETTGPSVVINSVFSRCAIQNLGLRPGEMNKMVKNFFLSVEVKYNNFAGLFERAHRKLGTLTRDEMYGFVPALMLGGSEHIDNLERVSTLEHLTLLSQLAELEPYGFSDL